MTNEFKEEIITITSNIIAMQDELRNAISMLYVSDDEEAKQMEKKAESAYKKASALVAQLRTIYR